MKMSAYADSKHATGMDSRRSVSGSVGGVSWVGPSDVYRGNEGKSRQLLQTQITWLWRKSSTRSNFSGTEQELMHRSLTTPVGSKRTIKEI